ncbi:MAG: translocation/assembly module TamB domain-containing protein [Chitinispirillia bacterium]|nr:translocation/assembly module TamB domain-containing protein [Chitinispirillia bacterium]
MTKLKRALLWGSAGALAAAIMLFTISVMFFYLLLYPPFQQRALRFAEAEMNKFFLGEISIERIESNLISRVDFYGLRATGSAEFGDSITAKHVVAHYWFPSIFKKTVNVRHVHATDVRGHIVMAPGNDILLPFLPAFLKDPNRKKSDDGKEKEEKSGDNRTNPDNWPVKMVLGNAKVDGINAVYRDHSNNMVGEIKNAAATANFHKLDSFSVELKVPQGSYRSPWWDGEIDTLWAAGTVTWKNLHVNAMLLEGSGTRITGYGGLSYFKNDPWDMHANFKTAVPPVPVLYTYDKGVGKEGILEGTASFRGTLNHPVLSSRVRGSNLRYRGQQIKTLNVEADYGSDEYGRAKIRGVSDLGLFEVNAALLMEALIRGGGGPAFGYYSVSADLTELDAEGISKELNIGDFTTGADNGNVRFNASGSGLNVPSFVDLSANLSGGALGSPFNMGVVLSNDLWSLRGSFGSNRFEGSGRLNSENGKVSGSLSARLPDPAAFTYIFAKERAEGLIMSHVDIDGYVYDPSITASLKGTDVKWRGMRSDSADILLSVNNGKVDIKRAEAHAAGEIDSLFTFLKLDYPLTGEVEADLFLNGGRDSLFLHASVSGRNLNYGGISVDTAYGLALIRGDTVLWKDIRLKEKNTHALSNGTVILGSDIKLQGSADLFVERDNIKIPAGELKARGILRGDSVKAKYKITSAQLELLDPWVPPEHRVLGVLSSSGNIWGTVHNPGAKVNYTIADPHYGAVKAHSITGNASLTDSLVNANAKLRLNGTEAVDFTAALPFLPASKWVIDESGDRAAFVKSNAKNLDINTLAALLGPDYKARGRTDFEIQISNMGSGWDVGGKVYLPDGDIQYLPLDIHAKNVSFSANAAFTSDYQDASFVLESGNIDMPMFSIKNSIVRGHSSAGTLIVDEAHIWVDDNAFISLTARMPYSGIDSLMYNRNIDAKYLVKNFPAQFFSTFLPQYGLRGGVFNGAGEIYTGRGRPLVDGDLTLSRLDFTIPDIYPSIGPINAQFKFTDNVIMLTNASSRWGRGTARAWGHAYWDADRIYDLDLNLRAGRLAFELPGVVQVGIESADLKLTDENEKFVVGGRIALAPSHYVRDVSIMEMINNMQIRDDIRREPNPVLQSILFRIDLDLANNMNVNMNLGTLLADGRLSLMGSAAEPGFVGEIKVIDGFVYYLDRKFKIEEGTLFNADPARVNPNLNIIAEADVSTYSPLTRGEHFTITLSITGNMENPVVHFTADPDLSELDILSVLTLGQRMGSVGSDINDRLANIAAQQAIGLGTRRLERVLPVDRVSVGGDVLGTTDSRGATLSVTKRLSSRFLLTYETFMGKLSDRKVIAHYRLTPYLYLEGQTTSDGENAMDFIFRYSR